jgi:hypothetical protein
MKCYICKREEAEFANIFKAKLEILKQELQELYKKESDLKDTYAKENGFTTEILQALETIDEKYLALKYNSYVENQGIFDELDKNIIILKNYYIKYNPPIASSKDVYRHYGQTTLDITLKDILDAYRLEPLDYRLDPLQKKLQKKINAILPIIKQIENTGSYFFETEVTFRYMRNIPSYHLIIFERYLSNKVQLCPYCAAMINAASQASLALKQAEEQNDWD